MSNISVPLDRTSAPEIRSFDKISFHGTSHTSLSNGAELYYINEGEQDIVKIEIYLNAGQTAEVKNLTANFTARLLNEGTRQRTAKEIAEEIDYYGASLRAKANQDFTIISVLTLNKYLDQMLELTADVLSNATFPQKEFDTVIRNSRQKFSINKGKTDFLASLKFRELMFGTEHPYGYPVTDQGLADLSTKDLKQFYTDRYDLSTAKIFASGKVGEAQIASINSCLGALSRKGSSTSELAKNEENKSYRVETIHRDNALQAAIRLGRFLPGKEHEDYNALVILNTIMGGYFGSRLMSNIREEKGFTYGIYSIMSPFLQRNHMMIRTEVGVQHAEAALTEIWKELEKLKTEKVSDKELNLVKNYMLGNLLNESNGPFNKINTAKKLYLYGLKNEDFSSYIETIKNIDATRLQELAIRYYIKDAFTLVLAKD